MGYDKHKAHLGIYLPPELVGELRRRAPGRGHRSSLSRWIEEAIRARLAREP